MEDGHDVGGEIVGLLLVDCAICIEESEVLEEVWLADNSAADSAGKRLLNEDHSTYEVGRTRTYHNRREQFPSTPRMPALLAVRQGLRAYVEDELTIDSDILEDGWHIGRSPRVGSEMGGSGSNQSHKKRLSEKEVFKYHAAFEFDHRLTTKNEACHVKCEEAPQCCKIALRVNEIQGTKKRNLYIY